jgi:signal transduction histidine kinase
MSHELRTPLGAITGFTDLLKKTALNPVQKDYLEAISTSGHSLLSIINDILDLSKLDAGRFIIGPSTLIFSAKAAISSWTASAKARNSGTKSRWNSTRQVIGILYDENYMPYILERREFCIMPFMPDCHLVPIVSFV